MWNESWDISAMLVPEAEKIWALLQLAPSLGLTLERNDDPAALQDFLNAGLDLWDGQQDLIGNDARMKLDSALARLCATRPGPDDEGYQAVVDNPPSLDQLQAFFHALRDEVEISLVSRRTE